MKKCIPVVLVLLCLCACAKPASTPTPTVPQPTATAPVVPEPIPEPTVVYEKAVEDYLGYIYDFSWYQEHKPQYVMIHFCSAVVDHRDDPYNMDYVRQTFIDADVSIHYILDREGTVYCYIPENRVAWHAGVGQWKGEEKYKNNLNRYSIGIEVVAIGSQEDMALYLTPEEYAALDPSLLGYTDAQYEALADLVADICRRHDIPLDREHVIGHQEFSPHKNDPGQLFDWSRIVPET